MLSKDLYIPHLYGVSLEEARSLIDEGVINGLVLCWNGWGTSRGEAMKRNLDGNRFDSIEGGLSRAINNASYLQSLLEVLVEIDTVLLRAINKDDPIAHVIDEIVKAREKQGKTTEIFY